MNILKDLEKYIEDYNVFSNFNFSIDTIRINFKKTHTLKN